MSDTKEIKDLIGREEVVDRIFSLVKNLKKGKNFCLALDGEWGSGKTFVMKMLEQKFGKPQGYVVIKYDAWANNFYDDPLIAILSCLLDGIDEKLYLVEDYKTKISTTAKLTAERIAKCSKVVNALHEICEGVREAIATFHNPIDTTKLEDFKSYQKLLRDTKAILNKITEIEEYRSKQTKLIILVDEIDRCLPDEQLRILERVHHLLDVKNCAVICAINKTRMIQNIEGNREDESGTEYLRKFFDYTYRIEMDSGKLLKYLITQDFYERFENFTGRKWSNRNFVEGLYRVLQQSMDENNSTYQFDNREMTRFYQSILNVLDCFGWEKINAYYIYFVVLTLFFKRFYQTYETFRMLGTEPNLIKDYVRAELRTDYPMEDIWYGPRQMDKRYENKYLFYFNSFMHIIETECRVEFSMDNGRFNGEDLFVLQELINIYGG